MDQWISAHGVKGSALILDCRTCTHELVPINSTELVFLGKSLFTRLSRLGLGIKWDASSRWPLRPNFTWGSIETKTIGNSHPTIERTVLRSCLKQYLRFLCSVTNSNVKHALVGGEYSKRRDSCYSASEKLGAKSLREVTLEQVKGSCN